MNKTYIYELNKNGIPFYIGKTINPKNRLSEHKQVHGKNTSMIVIDSVDSLDKKDWEPLEEYWIRQYKYWGFDLQNKINAGTGNAATGKWTHKHHIEYNKQWLKENREKHRNITKKYRSKSDIIEKEKEYHSKRYKENNEYYREYNKNPEVKERNKPCQKKWYEKNKNNPEFIEKRKKYRNEYNKRKREAKNG